MNSDMYSIDDSNNFQNCAQHCWCAYNENDKIIKQLKAELIVKAVKATPHEHGTDKSRCTGCLMSGEKAIWTS